MQFTLSDLLTLTGKFAPYEAIARGQRHLRIGVIPDLALIMANGVVWSPSSVDVTLELFARSRISAVSLDHHERCNERVVGRSVIRGDRSPQWHACTTGNGIQRISMIVIRVGVDS